MTENLLNKLEEKMMALVTEVETLRRDLYRVTQENTVLKLEKDNHTTKVQDLISLLDAVNVMEAATAKVDLALAGANQGFAQ